MTEIELRNKVCGQARAWLGRKEADGSHREIIDLYNFFRLPGSYAMTYTDPWCAAFVSAVGMACGLRDVILPHVNCDGMIAAYKLAGGWIENDAYVPKSGDLIFYDWQDSGVGDNTGSSDHVGLVVDVNGDEITVIEGNKSDMVAYRTIRRNGQYIRGYAVPDYVIAIDAEFTDIPETVPGAAVILDKPEGAVGAVEMQQGTESATPQYHSYHYSVQLNLLKIGDHGPLVKNVQILLNAHGFDCDETGTFDSATVKAVEAFQSAYSLDVDGEVGGQTYGKLLTT